MQKLLAILLLATLPGCAMIQSFGITETDPIVTGSMANVKKEFDSIPPPATGRPVTVAVYGFTDKTGQRKPQSNIASLSSAVTQGAETFLIKALGDVGGGRWFEVVERVGIDNLTKERTIIRQMREAYEGANAKPLMPMQFAGIIMEGGIVGYDTSVNSGGAGMRVFGIGKQTQWSQDTVTISLRAVSVNTGKVLATVTVQKTIMSSADSASALKFYDAGTQAFEAEAGLTINEPGTYAVKSAVEQAVIELIKEGKAKGIWEYRQDPVSAVIVPQGPQPLALPPAQVISSEIKTTETRVEPKPVVKAEPEVKKDPVVAPVVRVTPVKPAESVNNASLNADSCLYKDFNTSSQCVWILKKGTPLLAVNNQIFKDWLLVTASDGKKGFVKKEVLIF